MTADAPLRTAPDFDLSRFLGSWFEIATLPVPQGRTLHDAAIADPSEWSTYTYSPRPDGRLDVLHRTGQNDATRADTGASIDAAPARATRVRAQPRVLRGVAQAGGGDGTDRAKLCIEFPPFRAEYWVIGVDPDYEWAVIGEPARRYLWLVARTPYVPDDVFDQMLRVAAGHGYETSALQRVPAALPDDGSRAGDHLR